MSRKVSNSGLIILIMLGLIVCSPLTPQRDAPTSASRVAPLNSPVAVAATSIVPITGVPVELGSGFLYVDGGILVAVPKGEFVMGSPATNTFEHYIRLDEYWIHSTKVTNQQYAVCQNLGQCSPPDPLDNPGYKNIRRANNPVVGVTYDQASAYCNFIHGRLPTEAEWEKTARGPNGNIYPWGSGSPSCELLNFYPCTEGTTNVLRYPQGKSFYGALDMAGNAFEWVADWYDESYYFDSPEVNPQGPQNGVQRSVRSSGNRSTSEEVAVANRFSEDPGKHRPDLGFRCVVDTPDYFALFCSAPVVYGQSAQQIAAQVTDDFESCPDIGITQLKSCSGKLSTTIVTFGGPEDAIINPDGCAPTADFNRYSCQSTAVVSITASCQVNFSGEPDCLTGYTQDDAACRGTSVTTDCLPGMIYDSTQGCCKGDNQKGLSADLPTCPVGTYYIKSHNACAPTPLRGIVSVVQSIEFRTCGPRPDNTCQEPAGGCVTPGTIWSTTRCCCLGYNTGYCYTR